MARLTSVKINYGRTVNLGNFESIRIDVELEAKIMEGDSAENMLDNIKKMAEIKVNQYIKDHNNGI